MYPLARTTGLTVQDLGDETLVYVRESHRAHCLNRSAALVWRHCDGRTPVAELTQIVSRELDVKPDERIVEVALHELQQARLLESAPQLNPRSYSRRRMLAMLGVSLVAVPTVLSVTAPRAHAQASPRLNGLINGGNGGGGAGGGGGGGGGTDDAPPDGTDDAPPDGTDDIQPDADGGADGGADA